MSTILKALRRLEEQKAASGPRPLREEVATAPAMPETPRARRWLPAAAIALGLGLASAAGVVLWQGNATPGPDVAAQPGTPPPTPRVAVEPTPRAQPRPSPPPRADEPPPRERLARQEPRDGPPEQAFASQVEVVRRPPVEPRVPIEIDRASDPMPDASPRASDPMPDASPRAVVPPAAKPTAASQRKSTPAEPKPATSASTRVAGSQPRSPARVAGNQPRSPAPVAVPPEPAPEPEPLKPPARTAKQPTPVASESKPTRVEAKPDSTPKVAEKQPTATPEPEVVAGPAAEASKMRVEKTLWHPKADRRVAFIAVGGEPSQRIREGDVVGRYVVSEIQPTGVVFLSDGKSVHHAIGAK